MRAALVRLPRYGVLGALRWLVNQRGVSEVMDACGVARREVEVWIVAAAVPDEHAAALKERRRAWRKRDEERVSYLRDMARGIDRELEQVGSAWHAYGELAELVGLSTRELDALH